MERNTVPGKLRTYQIMLLVLFPAVCSIFSLCVGRMTITLPEVWRWMMGQEINTVLSSMRLPRILLASLVGAGLAVSGCAFQSMFANPLATPDTLGVASGASCGAALGLLLGWGLLGVQGLAFAFGLAAVAMTWFMGNGKADRRATMILAGIMVSSLFSALVSLIKFTADTESQLPAITYWLMGSLSSANMKSLLWGAPVMLTGIVLMLLLRWKLNLLPLGEDESRTFGTNIRMLRIVTVLCATAMTGSCVALCGQVGWVGLLVPHICRMCFGSNHAKLIPASVFLGAGFMILVDTLARTVSASEIPVSILTALIGAPVFIAMVRKSGGWSL